ncbi:MAG: NADH-ubiquinone/plastoquinone oxidoreductase chain 6, partial [Bacteroidetes bacterium]|nr:NADH-ubiquinone/plastoquinone oxidoreductase chain 6 [Bacteroidota bacterium]
FYSTWRTAGSSMITLPPTTTSLGEMLMTGYLLPFEVASIILLVALIGAAMTARRNRKVAP